MSTFLCQVSSGMIQATHTNNCWISFFVFLHICSEFFLSIISSSYFLLFLAIASYFFYFFLYLIISPYVILGRLSSSYFFFFFLVILSSSYPFLFSVLSSYFFLLHPISPYFFLFLFLLLSHVGTPSSVGTPPWKLLETSWEHPGHSCDTFNM